MTYTDEHAVALLTELARYYNVPVSEFDPLDPAQVTVSELVWDLIDSIPRGSAPAGLEVFGFGAA